MACTTMADMAHIVVAYIVMAYIDMAYMRNPKKRRGNTATWAAHSLGWPL